MKILIIILSIVAAQAINPNIYFEAYNQSNSSNITKVYYRLSFYENSSTLFNINKHLNIFMIHYINRHAEVIEKRTILFVLKENNSTYVEENMTTSYDEKTTYIFDFYFNNILKLLFNCDSNLHKIFGKFYITEVLEKDKKFRVGNKVYPSWFEAYFYFYEKSEQHSQLIHDNLSFCKTELNLKLIFVIVSFSVFFVLIISLEVLNKVMKIRRKRRIAGGDNFRYSNWNRY